MSDCFFLQKLTYKAYIATNCNNDIKKLSLNYRWILYDTRFFRSNIFRSNTRLKLTKNQAKATQHPEAELKTIRFLHPRYHSKIIGDTLKNIQKISASVLMRLYD